MSMNSRNLNALATVGLLIAAGLFAGCSPAQPLVSGTILLNGEPLPSGAINFFPMEGTPGSDAGAAIAEGHYRIEKGLTVGKYRVEIRSAREIPGKSVRDPFFAKLVPAMKDAIPPEYKKLIREVHAGRNTIDFDLKKVVKSK
jgi:hypothetical protein